jgi:alpha-glucosidase
VDAFHEILRFWFDRGLAGFRIDVCHKLAKDAALRDNPQATDADSFIERAWGQRELHTANQPETHDVIRGWRRIADSYREQRILVGETYVHDLGTMASYYGAGDELHLAFNIPFLWTPFRARALRAVVEATERALPAHAWPVWNGGSHDISRMASRWGGGDPARIRCALMMLLTLRGTPLLYYGDEIGMPDTPLAPGRSKDPLGRRAGVPSAGRDIARTPMHWHGGPGAGFTDARARPWLPLGDAGACNVQAQRDDPASVLHLCRDLIAARRAGTDLTRGAYAPLDAPDGVFAYRRGAATVVAINLSPDAHELSDVPGTVLVATDRERDGERVTGPLRLPPWTGVVLTT